MRSVDDLDDKSHCKSCVKQLEKRLRVFVDLNSERIDMDVTLGDTQKYVKERIQEACRRMTGQAENTYRNLNLFYKRNWFGFDNPIIYDFLSDNPTTTDGQRSVHIPSFMELKIGCSVCKEITEAVDEFGHCKECTPLSEEKRKVSVQFDSRTIVMDVTLGDTVLSVHERIKEAHGLTRDATSIKLYDDRRHTFATNLRATILDHYWMDIYYAGRRNIPSVIELTAELEEE